VLVLQQSEITFKLEGLAVGMGQKTSNGSVENIISKGIGLELNHLR